jgi:predicted RNase H-like nuclease (RuvC/YqgF family)
MEHVNEALIARLEKVVTDGFDKLERMLNNIEKRVQTLEKDNAAIRSTQELRIKNVEENYKEDHKKIEDLDDKVQALDDRMKLIMWVGGIVGAAVILYLLNGWLALL